MRQKRIGATGVAVLAVLLAITGKLIYNLFLNISKHLKSFTLIETDRSNTFRCIIDCQSCTHCLVYLCGYRCDIKTGSVADTGMVCEITPMIHSICRLYFK